ncbi:hypothetical protein [Cellulomonas sp. S1-8]|uniref:hypothetical protein n=1 Tax=Cellulomonas sp. S1-8 TaxID=2904790 RepID=UPI0022432C8F|nr:hypothetical protein [Cellulomonas sp. S1-8]UZN04602.1 hypothetical protein OKX07_06715 [Cellulomonas sp. S1-8]
MDIFWLVVTLLAVASWLGWLTRVVRDDGLGHRSPPPSHHDDAAPVTHVFSR